MLPLDGLAAQIRRHMQGTFALLTTLATFGVVGLGIVFRLLRNSAELNDQVNGQLNEVNRDLEQKHQQLQSLLRSVDQQNEELKSAKSEADKRAGELELTYRQLEGEVEQRRQAQEALLATEK